MTNNTEMNTTEKSNPEIVDINATVTETKEIASSLIVLKKRADEPSEEQQSEGNEMELHPENFLLTFKNDGSIKKINDLPLAILFQKSRFIVYAEDEDPAGFYEYHPKTGLWKNISEVVLEKEVTDFAFEYFRLAGRNDAYFALNNMRGVIRFLKQRAVVKEFFSHPILEQDSKAKYCLHCANGVIEFSEDGDMELKPFSPNYRSRFRCEQCYNPQEPEPEMFLTKLINPALDEADRDMLQLYAGQCLLGKNITQTFMALVGNGASGKSTVVNVIKQIIGETLCAPLRIEHSNGRFEVGQWMGKSLLLGCDVMSTYLNTDKCNLIKSLTGKDALKVEFKGRNETRTIRGEFNLLITSNSFLHIRTDNSPDAWERRALCICYNREPPKDPIRNFDEVLVREEGSGILNWMLAGAVKLLRNGGKIVRQPKQLERVRLMLEDADPVKSFVEDHVEEDEMSSLTNEELWAQYNGALNKEGLEPINYKSFIQSLKGIMMQFFEKRLRHDIVRSNRRCRGFSGVRFKEVLCGASGAAEGSGISQQLAY